MIPSDRRIPRQLSIGFHRNCRRRRECLIIQIQSVTKGTVPHVPWATSGLILNHLQAVDDLRLGEIRLTADESGTHPSESVTK
jgi:hypothetical protein